MTNNSQDIYTNQEMEDNLLAPYRNGLTPGCAIGVIKDGKIIYSDTSGFANIERHISITTNTNFRLASVSKQFTAVAILIFVQNGKLSLDTKIRDFFPEFSDYMEDITVQHLLTHTSGLGEYDAETIPEYEGKQIYDSDVVKILSKKKMLDSVPGEKYFYNNGGYCLLKLIVEKVSGQEFRNFLKENIFTKLDMEATMPNKEGVTIIPNRAYGYSNKEGKWLRTDQRQTSTTMGDGGIYSSVNDLALWSEIIHSNKILSPEMKTLMFTKHVLTDEGPGIYYGFGLFLKEENDKLIAYHGGSTVGFEIGIYYALAEGMTFIFLSNVTGEEGSTKVAQFAEEYLRRSNI